MMHPSHVYTALSLRTKLAVWTTAGVLAIVALLTSLSLLALRQDLTRGAADAQATLIDNVAHDLDEKIELRRSALSMHSDGLGQRVVLGNVPAVDDYFSSRPLLSSLFDAVLLADTSGMLIYDTPQLAGRRGRSVADRDYFQQVMKHGQAVISEPLAGRTTGQAAVRFVVPVRSESGTTVGVLIGVVYLDQPNFLGTLGARRIGKAGHFALMTRGERPVMVMHAHRDRIMKPVARDENPHVAQALQGFQGTVDEADAAGLEALFSYRSLQSVPWVLASVYPTAEAYAALRERERDGLLAGAVIAAASGLATWLLAAHLLRPLQRLQQAMQAHRLHPEMPIEQIDVRSKDIAALAGAYAELMRDRQQADAALRRSERRLRAIADHLPALVSYVDKNGIFRFTNAQYGPFYGIDPQSLIGTKVRDLIGEASHAAMRDRFAAVLRGEPQQYEHSGAGRSRDRHVLISFIPDFNADGTVDGFYVMIADITARRNAEVEQALSERRLKAVTDNLPAVITHVDAEQRLTFCNRRAREVFGLDPQWPPGRSTLQDVLPASVHQTILPHAVRALAGETVPFEWSSRATGQLHHYRSDYIPDRDEQGAVRGFYAMTFDITPSKTLEVQVADNERMLRTITDNLPVLISYVDSDETLRFVNGTFKSWMGIDPATATERPLHDVIGSVHYAAWRSPLLRALGGERCEFAGVMKNTAGVERRLHNTYIPDRRPDGSVAGIFMLGTDITAMKAAQQQLGDIARVDPPTGLPNRRQLDEALARS